MVSAIAREESIGSKRTRAICAAMRKIAAVKATETVASNPCPRRRRVQAASGPNSNATTATAAGNRSAANDAPVRSKN